MTETSTGGTTNMPGANKIGTVGRPGPRGRAEDRRGRRAAAQGSERLPRLLQEPGSDRPRRSSTAGSTPVTSPRSTMTATSRSSAARRRSSSPPAARTSRRSTSKQEVKRHPLVSQCVVIGDRRPYLIALITLDQEAADPLRRRAGNARRAGRDDQQPAGPGRRSSSTSKRSTSTSPGSNRSSVSRSCRTI